MIRLNIQSSAELLTFRLQSSLKARQTILDFVRLLYFTICTARLLHMAAWLQGDLGLGVTAFRNEPGKHVVRLHQSTKPSRLLRVAIVPMTYMLPSEWSMPARFVTFA